MTPAEIVAYGTTLGPLGLLALAVWQVIMAARKDTPAKASVSTPDLISEKIERILAGQERILAGQEKIADKMEKIAESMSIISERLAVSMAVQADRAAHHPQNQFAPQGR